MSRQELLTHLKNLYSYMKQKSRIKGTREELESYANQLQAFIYQMDDSLGHKNWQIERI